MGRPRRNSVVPRPAVWAAAAAVALFASPAVANPGTAIMTGLLALVVGNLIIGIVEGGVAVAMGARRWALPGLIVANYFSAWLGWFIVSGYGLYWRTFEALGGEPMRDAIPATWITFIGLTAFGLLAEGPFYWFVFPRKFDGRRKRVLVTLLAANLLTAAGLAVYYAVNTRASLVTELRLASDPAEVGGDIDGPQPWVYYIAADEHTIRRVRPDGSGEETVRVLQNSLEDERLLAVQPDDLPPMLALTWPGEWDDLSHPLVAEVLAGRELTEYESVFCLLGIEPDAGERAAVFDRDRVLGAQQQWVAPYGPAADMRAEAERTFDATFSWDAWRGIRFQGADAPPALALDNAFMARNFAPFGVAILPGEVLIFELAHEYNGYHAGIYAASLRSRAIARLTDGRNPVVVYPHANPAD